jgi:hypothetical protein
MTPNLNSIDSIYKTLQPTHRALIKAIPLMEAAMAVDGTWQITVDTPMGKQEGKLLLKTQGTTLTGTQEGQGGSMSIDNGKVDGNTLTWTSEMTQPFAIKLEFTVTVNGDEMSGGVKAGDFGTSPLTGKRVA